MNRKVQEPSIKSLMFAFMSTFVWILSIGLYVFTILKCREVCHREIYKDIYLLDRKGLMLSNSDAGGISYGQV